MLKMRGADEHAGKKQGRQSRFYRRFVLGFILVMLIYGFFSGLFGYMWEERLDLYYLLQQHIYLVGISFTLALLIGLFTGLFLSRGPLEKYQNLIMYFVGLGQTVPSLAVLALSMTFLGVGSRPAVLALTVYSVLPIARNTLAGFNSVPPELIDAGRGLGLSPLQILIHVEIPGAIPVIMAGIRMALVLNIGTAALGALIGAGGLGEQIFTGISFFNFNLILSGALPVALLALAADFFLRMIEEQFNSG